MNELSRALEIASQVLTIFILVGGVIAFLCRQWISEWIKSRFAKEVGEELARQTHQFNRDLEAYKGSLLQELEQFRANIDIRRSIALKTADARIEALRSLAYALDQYSTECVTWPGLTPNLRKRNMSEYLEAMKNVRKAKRSANIFIPIEVTQQITDAMVAGSQLVVKFPPDNEVVLGPDDAELMAVMNKFVVAENSVKAQLNLAPAQLA